MIFIFYPSQITICAPDQLNIELLKENGFGGFADLFAGIKAKIKSAKKNYRFTFFNINLTVLVLN